MEQRFPNFYKVVKETKSATMNIFQFFFLFKSFVKVELSYVFTINMFTIGENCTESELSYKTGVFFSCWLLFASLK